MHNVCKGPCLWSRRAREAFLLRRGPWTTHCDNHRSHGSPGYADAREGRVPSKESGQPRRTPTTVPAGVKRYLANKSVHGGTSHIPKAPIKVSTSNKLVQIVDGRNVKVKFVAIELIRPPTGPRGRLGKHRQSSWRWIPRARPQLLLAAPARSGFRKKSGTNPQLQKYHV